MNSIKQCNAGMFYSLIFSAASAAGLALSVPAVSATPAWKPDRAVEIIVNTAPGSSPDTTARLIQKMFQNSQAVQVPSIVTNKPGGGGAVAYTYLNQFASNGHYIFVASKTLLTSYIMGRSKFTHTDVTPISHLFGEYIAVAVKADSPIKSGRDLIEQLKFDPSAYSFGIATSLGNTNHQALAAALKVSGVPLTKLKNVVFQSGGNAITALLGGHVDAVPVSIGSWANYLKNGQVRIIAVAAPQRLPGMFADVPTWKEQGANVIVSNWRTIVAPKGLSAAQIAYWEKTLEQMSKRPEWIKEVESVNGTIEFMNSAQTKKLLEEDYGEIKSFLTELGLAK